MINRIYTDTHTHRKTIYSWSTYDIKWTQILVCDGQTIVFLIWKTLVVMPTCSLKSTRLVVSELVEVNTLCSQSNNLDGSVLGAVTFTFTFMFMFTSVPHQSFLHGQLGQWMPYKFVRDSFHTGVTAEALRAKIDDFAPTRSLWSKISGTRGRPPPIICMHSALHIWTCALAGWLPGFVDRLTCRMAVAVLC